jgi:hypothetical protein
MKQIIKINENTLEEIIKETVNRIFEERNRNYNYKHRDKRTKVAQYLNGKNREEIHDEWMDIMAKRQALKDMAMDNPFDLVPRDEREFYHCVTPRTFKIDFSSLNDCDDYNHSI